MPRRPCASCTVATPASARPWITSASARAMFWTTTAMSVPLARHGWRAMGMEALDGLEPPGLALLPVRLRPDHRFPVGCQDQPCSGVGQLHPIARGLPDVEEEGALHRVLVRPGLDVHAVLEEDVGGPQDVLALVDRVGDMVQARPPAAMLLGAGEVVGLVVDREPAAAEPTVVEPDHLGDTGP